MSMGLKLNILVVLKEGVIEKITQPIMLELGIQCNHMLHQCHLPKIKDLEHNIKKKNEVEVKLRAIGKLVLKVLTALKI